MIKHTLINLHPNEYSQGLRYYPFGINLYRCVRSCNIIHNLSRKVCKPNKTEDLNINFFNTITGINESKILTKHISCKCECKFDGRKYNSNQKWNNGKCRCECENPKEQSSCEKDYIWNPATCSCKNSKYLEGDYV